MVMKTATIHMDESADHEVGQIAMFTDTVLVVYWPNREELEVFKGLFHLKSKYPESTVALDTNYQSVIRRLQSKISRDSWELSNYHEMLRDKRSEEINIMGGGG